MTSAITSTMPLVSIIMPWYNTNVLRVESAISSVIEQDYAGPIELVICNDGSSKDNLRTLDQMLQNQQWGRVDCRLVHHRRNLGISAARNSAIQKAEGEWFIWLDADDQLAVSAIQKMLAAMIDSSACQMGISQCLFLEGGERWLRDSQLYFNLAMKYRDSVYDPLVQSVFSIQAQLVNRHAVEEIGGFSPHYQWAEVTEFFLRFVSKFTIEAIQAIDLPLYIYFRRKGSTHSGDRRSLFKARKSALLEYADRQSIVIDDLKYLGRSYNTGAQHYLPVVGGHVLHPPYLHLSENGFRVATPDSNAPKGS